jgi:hypothetical protein
MLIRASMVLCAGVVVFSLSSTAWATPGKTKKAAAAEKAKTDYYAAALKRCQARRAQIAEYKKTGRLVIRKQRVEIGGPVEWRTIFVHPRLCLAGAQIYNIREDETLVMVFPQIIRRRKAQIARCAAGLKTPAPGGVAWIKLRVDAAGRYTRWSASGERRLAPQARCIGRGLAGRWGFKPWGKGGWVKLALVALD